MGKRIGGVLALLIGLGITVFCAVRLAYRIPSNFTADGEGLDFLINIAVKYELRGYIVQTICNTIMCKICIRGYFGISRIRTCGDCHYNYT